MNGSTSQSELPQTAPDVTVARIDAFDGIRGAAILWVAFHNTTDVLAAPSSGPVHLLALILHPGWIGVQLFFALSGFLITDGLFAAQQAQNYFSGFYARRALRIFPLYYLALFVTLILVPLAVRPTPPLLGPALDHQIWLWLFGINWTHGAMPGFGHFWSLAVEEQFYLLWPLVVYRLSPVRLLKTCVVIAMVVFVVRSSLAMTGSSAEALYNSTVCRVDALVFGGAGAALLRIPEARRWFTAHLGSLSWSAIFLALAGFFATSGYDTNGLACKTFGYTLLAYCCAVFVVAVAQSSGGSGKKSSGWIVRILESRILRSCGKYSYAMYIFHAMFHKLVGEPWLRSAYPDRIPTNVVLVYAVTVVMVSYVTALCSFYLYESHFLRLKRHFKPRGIRVRASSTSRVLP
jgi:peptidoglycan/LPS O-acetylase OafA/YrhL